MHRCHSIEELARLPAPMLVLASQPDLESGFAREMFAHWAPDARNLIVLVDRSTPGTLARRLVRERPREVTLALSKRVALQGEELSQHRRAQEITRLQELDARRLRQAQREMLEAQEMDEGGEEELVVSDMYKLLTDNPYFDKPGHYDLVVTDQLPSPPVFPFTLAAQSSAALSVVPTTSASDVGEW